MNLYQDIRTGLKGADYIIVLSNLADKQLAIKTVQEGGQDYLVKGQLDSHALVRTTRYAIERKRTEELLRAHSLQVDGRRRLLSYRCPGSATFRTRLFERQKSNCSFQRIQPEPGLDLKVLGPAGRFSFSPRRRGRLLKSKPFFPE